MRGGQHIAWTAVFVMRMSSDLWVMRRIVVTKNALAVLHKRICVMNFHGISQLGTDNFVNIEITFLPKQNPASNESVVLIRCQASDFTLNFRAFHTAQTALYARKIIPNFHPARAASSRMNLRTGRDVRYK